tara:strand:- start:1161 stop:1451 length:291 start_codon:yes stop_codon:yes gene_type:complete
MSETTLKKTNGFGYTFEVETVKQDELKPGSHVEVNWASPHLTPILYSGKYIKKLKKYHQIRIIDESWFYSTPFVQVPLDVIFKVTTPRGIKEEATA